jgi:hypothetical protein
MDATTPNEQPSPDDSQSIRPVQQFDVAFSSREPVGRRMMRRVFDDATRGQDSSDHEGDDENPQFPRRVPAHADRSEAAMRDAVPAGDSRRGTECTIDLASHGYRIAAADATLAAS